MSIKYAWLWAIGLVALVNLLLFFGVYRNRGATLPDALVTLTERELRPEPRYYGNREDSGLVLRLRKNEFVRDGWFDRAKLEELGFDCRLEPAAGDAYDYYRHQPSRRAWVVLEYEGEAWQKFMSEQEEKILEKESRADLDGSNPAVIKNRIEELERNIHNSSRLFSIDAGPDPAALRRRYPENSRYIIAAAEVRLRFNRSGLKDRTDPQLTGYVARILTDRIHVPLEVRRPLDELLRKKGGEADRFGFYSGKQRLPRYRVILKYGGCYEPWIERIEPIKAPAPKATAN